MPPPLSFCSIDTIAHTTLTRKVREGSSTISHRSQKEEKALQWKDEGKEYTLFIPVEVEDVEVLFGAS